MCTLKLGSGHSGKCSGAITSSLLWFIFFCLFKAEVATKSLAQSKKLLYAEGGDHFVFQGCIAGSFWVDMGTTAELLVETECF